MSGVLAACSLFGASYAHGAGVTGEDPEKTIIRWDGPADENMFLYDAWYASLSRLILDGAGKGVPIW
jgi:hypothetical protein